jgi:nucleoside 2-deoxyribosyltransferase
MDRIEELEGKLRNEGVEVLASKETDDRGIIGCLGKIDKADIVYVVDPNGDVGKSVSVDIGYAYARKKPIYVMSQIDDPPVMNLVKAVLSFEELLTLLRSRD